MVAQSDEWSVGRPPVDQVQQNLLVVDSQVVHVLWGEEEEKEEEEVTKRQQSDAIVPLVWNGAVPRVSNLLVQK